jgi:hypothetical protein
MEQDEGIELLSTEELHNLMPYKRFKLQKWRAATRATPNNYGIRVKKLSDLPADIANGVTIGFDQFGNRVQVSLASKEKYEYLCDKAGRAIISVHVIQTSEDDVAGCDPCMFGDTWENRLQVAYDILVMGAKSRFFLEN